jgi:diguanylate cyclase (GGDEF)-like protein
VLGFVILFYFYFLNTALRKEISKRNDVERELKVLAQLDFLTGSDNRCVFERSLEREFERAHRHDQPLTLLMIDIDDFKRINDSFGHLAGDEVLKSFVTVSKNLLRKSDLFARYGGEEFVILMPVTRLNDAVLLAHRLLNHVREDRVNFEGKSINYTISIGLAEINDSDENPHELLKRSDMMLYKAKQSGKDCLMH